MADATARPFTLRDVMEYNQSSEVEVLNEINEGIVRLSDLDECVSRIEDVLTDKLLDRRVIGTWVSGSVYVVQVEGEEDAE